MKRNDCLTEKQKEKLEFIELLTYFHGIINREDIIKKFNVSAASATNILSKYSQIAPKNLDYNIHLKSYEISKTFNPIFNTQMFLERIPVYTIPTLNKQIDIDEIDRIAMISRAIQRVHSLKITYSSISSGTSNREIVPVAFANTLLRWHLRAYDRKRKRYADFVFRRISKVKQVESDTIKKHEHPNNDKQWHLFIDLKIKAHPHNVADTNTISSNIYNIRIRAAMAGYFLQLWNIDCSSNSNLKGKKYQYLLENIEEVSKLTDLKLAPGYVEQKN